MLVDAVRERRRPRMDAAELPWMALFASPERIDKYRPRVTVVSA
ncbi:hypothetical protein KT71_000298 [Congregibacter litoralis KT71]|uniref:Uncharacterized protein n=1 Tax=Congregibacter litoralis KT71 TaxID=314285 RepID=V7HUY6_9GAMM|nr:hypothetical protein KT71_000298 [Congregibacter litoralis KT71]